MQLPQEFVEQLRNLEATYLAEDDPIRQSGFSGGAQRWREKREPILEAVEGDGTFVGIGCANGYLLECLVDWGRERGIRLGPYGLDQGARLIELAMQRFTGLTTHFFAANAWDWHPPRRCLYAYTLYDCVPVEFLTEYIHRLEKRILEPGGRLIIGAYGSRSDSVPPFDIASFLEKHGFAVAGTATGGSPPVASFAWIDAKENVGH